MLSSLLGYTCVILDHIVYFCIYVLHCIVETLIYFVFGSQTIK